MKIQRGWEVQIPFYLKPFAVFHYNRKMVKIGVLPVLRFYGDILWFAFPNWLHKYNVRDCVNFIPDYLDPKVGGPASGTKIRPFLGMVLILEENAMFNKFWWKNIEIRWRR